MKKLKLNLFVLFILCANVLTIQAQNNNSNLIEKKENGVINWTQQYIEATGMSIIDNERWKLPEQAKEMAERGAKVVAQRNLLEIVQGVKVTSTTTVKDMITQSDVIITKVQGVVRGAEIVGEPIVTKNYVKITLRMPIYAQNGLAPAFSNSIDYTTKTSGFKNTNETTEVVNTIALNIPKGQKITTNMFPKFVDEEGNELLNTAKFYNPSEGKFPKFAKLTKSILKGNIKGVEIIDVLPDEFGNIRIKGKDRPKLRKFLNGLLTVSKIALKILL